MDTEEEWDWNGPFPDETISVENVKEIPQFQAGLNELGVVPTYFLDYAVIANEQAKLTLQTIQKENPKIEFGAHLHPWVTPPITSIRSEADSHIVNLPIDSVRAQIDTLTTAIERNFNSRPVSFRSGRWGINNDILLHLVNTGYLVDSSVYPFYKNAWFNYEDTSFEPGYLYPTPTQEKRVFELPVTAGFNKSDYVSANKLHKFLETNPISYLKPIGTLWQLGLLRKIYLSPELSSTADMISLCKTALKNGTPVIHMYLHSSSLLPGVSTYVKNKKDKLELLERIAKVIHYLKAHVDLEMVTVSEAALQLAPNAEEKLDAQH
jgi:hypothetical protein